MYFSIKDNHEFARASNKHANEFTISLLAVKLFKLLLCRRTGVVCGESTKHRVRSHFIQITKLHVFYGLGSGTRQGFWV